MRKKMKNLNYSTSQTTPAARLQRGIVTTFTGVLILLLLTMMMFFAMRVGVFDQRSSANDMRQKLAFHTAESGLHHAKEFFRANSVIASSPVENILPNGTDGWLSTAAGAARWQKCSEAGLNLATGSGTHPCFGESVPARRPSLYYYSFDDSTFVPLDTDAKLPGTSETVGVQALLCVLDVDFDAVTPVQGCSTNTTDDSVAGYVDGSYYMITLLARGRGDCVGTDCKSEALVSEGMSNFGAVAGGQAPSVPLTTKSTFPPSGTAEIVPNPNSGGVGVPVSVWMNANTSCTNDAVVDPSSGSWATCEMQEWYGEDSMPDDYTCNGNCTCLKDESISYTHAGDNILGIDLVSDPNFPCDLFSFYFGVPKTSYELVKGYAKVLSDCETLGPSSTGIYWITGPECRINSNTIVGSPYAPVLLISAASTTRLNGGAIIYGIIYVTDAENSAAELEVNGTNTVYGQVIVDAELGQYTGTFQVVYNENTIGKASGGGGLGTLIGGWADFHPSWQ
jgi:hypothetical protein